MKLNYTIQDLRDQLRKAIYDAGINSRVQDDIINRIARKGYTRGFIRGVFEGNVLLDSLSLIDLGVFALEIFNEADIKYINPEIYLTDIELEDVKNYKVEITEDIFEYPVVFEDVRQVAGDIWSVVIPAQFIAKLGRSNMLNYDFDTQREATVVQLDDGIVLKPTINPQSIVEISEELVNDTFISNTLTFNMPFRDRENFKYDKKLKRWILLKGKLNIIDGYHRYQGIITALRKKDIPYNFELRLTNFDRDKARRFIVQEDKRNSISKEYIKSIDDSDLITQVINQLNESNRSELRGKITSDNTTIATGISLVSFEMMHNTIKKLWKPTTINDSDVLFDYLRAFFNGLVGLYPKQLKTEIQAFKRYSDIGDERMFILYLIIAKHIEKHDDWRGSLGVIMKELENNPELLKDYLSTPLNNFKYNFNRHFKIANNIIGVIVNGE